MTRHSTRHVLALGATVAALAMLAVPAFTWSPEQSPQQQATQQAPQAEREEPVELPVAAVLKPDETEYVAGESPQVQVRLRNDSDEPVVLVGSLDASDCKWRYPYCYFEIEGPPNAQQFGIGRCGNMNPLRKQDFVTVRPGDEFDPYRQVDDYGFFSCSQLDWHNFAVPGKYRLTWVYDTASKSSGEWLGDGTLDTVGKLLEQVPRGVARSNTIEITFAPPPEGYIPDTWIPRDHSEAIGRGSWFIYKLLATGPLNLRLAHERYIWLFDNEGLDTPQQIEDFRQLYENLAYEIAPLQRAGQDVSRPTTVAAINPDLEIRGDANIDDFDRIREHLTGPPTARTERPRDAVINSIVKLVPDERFDEEALVLFVFTDVEFESEDIPEFNLPGPPGRKLAIVRVTRRNESWIPQIVRKP